MALRETENNFYAKFWGDKYRALWYVMVILEWSINEMLLIPEGTYKSRPLDWIYQRAIFCSRLLL